VATDGKSGYPILINPHCLKTTVHQIVSDLLPKDFDHRNMVIVVDNW
jgi:hypothetical protein